MTKLVALIGYPLAHSITPRIYAATFETMGIDARCEPWVTPATALEENVRRLRASDVFGANVTVPHKESVVRLLDGMSSEAAAIGAVNCIVHESDRLTGFNTDLSGFMRSLREAGFDPRGRAAVLLGAGGAARAVAVGLLQAGASRLTIGGRDRDRVEAAMASLPSGGVPLRGLNWNQPEFADACAETDLIVNCTPVGTLHSPDERASPIDSKLLRPGIYVYDVVYNPPETPLLTAARRAGATPVGGLEMLIYQGAESIRLWTGIDPPLDVMRAAATVALAS